MKKLNLFLLMFVLFSALFVYGLPIPVQACSCAELPEVEEGLEQSKAVFSGEVLNIKEKVNRSGYRYKSVLLQVNNTWKGVKESQVIISTGLGGGDCGFDFAKGREYLGYAYKSDTDLYGADTLSTNICDRTNTIHAAQEDLEILGEGESPTDKISLIEKENERESIPKDIDHTENQKEGKRIPFIIWLLAPIGLLFLVALISFLFRKREN
ncbi:hypothetical protein J14TS2_25710 [Bacillus sp. J14TS2]|uniref:hypothetical protein n=1 Tax=Bacillus sp. J14TS2 TaxID=2807188 RepID=UPI001B05AC85|nr:hypothetical protein [Bacillus sp. J14TS2]GIN72096.1 hypothetical protein J14TS2_25710 [Bacillus sp. J14TS2]